MLTSDREVTEPAAVTDRRPPVRALRTARGLPGRRAVVGGLLVAVAVLGTAAAYAGATADHRLMYVVARHQLSPGQHLRASDLALAPLDLAPGQAAHAFRRPGALANAVVLGPVATGELVQSGLVVAAVDAAGDRRVSFAIDPARAVGGRLQAGDAVDVLATYGTGPEANTMVVVRGAVLVTVSTGGSAFGERQAQVVTLSLKKSSESLAVAHAASAGALTLVRSTGALPPDDSGSYRPPTPRTGA